MFYLKSVVVLPLETEQEVQTAQDEGSEQETQTAQDEEGAPSNSGMSEGGVLYITDDSGTARRLLGEGRAVLVYLHEGNRQEDFGFCKYACEDPKELDRRYLEQVYRRYRGIPWDILETDRCLIRETTEEDVEDI